MIGFAATLKTMTVKDTQDLWNELQELSKNRVLVGVPSATSERKEGEGIGNAALAYIHDKGSPKQGIPARPFMQPGIAKAQNRVNNELFAAAQASLAGDQEGLFLRLNRAGMFAMNSIRKVINIGDGFAPLKRSTLLARTRKRAYSWWGIDKETAKGLTHEQRMALRKQQRETIMSSMHPLIDTGQLRNAITYVIEDGEK